MSTDIHQRLIQTSSDREEVSAPLDIAILNAGIKRPAIVFARCASDMAVAKLPGGEKLKKLADFRNQINLALLRNLRRPTKSELIRFGNHLFNYIVRDDVKRLYDLLPADKHVRIHILTNRPDLQSLPWEYLQDPNQGPGPSIYRSVVRVLPRIGLSTPASFPLSKDGRKIRILFIYADPGTLDPVDWVAVKDSVRAEFSAFLPTDHYELKVVEGTPRAIYQEMESPGGTYDIFQFSGHGTVDLRTGEGCLLLLDDSGSGYLPWSASTLAMNLAGRGIKLAVLNACLTAAGNAVDPFNIVAEALLCSGIPAVVANQLPIPNKTVAPFVGSMYRMLLRTGDIDLAVSQGRIRLATDLSALPNAVLEWGIPTLYRHIAGANVFQVSEVTP
jgi:CHAT domain